MAYQQETLTEDMFIERYRDAVERLTESRTRRAALEGALKHARENEKGNQAALEKLLAGRESDAQQMPFTDINEEEATGGAEDGEDESDGASTALTVPPSSSNGGRSRSGSSRSRSRRSATTTPADAEEAEVID